MIKTNKVLSIFSSIITVAASVFFIYELVTLHLIPTKLLIPIVIIFILINAIILVLLNFYGKNIVTKLFMIMIVLVIACLSSFGGLYLMKTSNMFNQITKYNETVKQTVSVVVKENSAYEDLKDIKNQDLAVLEKDTVRNRLVIKSCLAFFSFPFVSSLATRRDNASSMPAQVRE